MIRESSRPKRSSNRARTGRARFSDSYRGSALRRRNAPTQSGARFPLLQSHGGCLVWSNDGGAVPINPAVSRNALHMPVPVDIISAPATNVCIGIAIDSMIHLMFGVRRAQRGGKKGWNAWVFAREEQWRGILFGRDYGRRLRHFRAIRFSANAAFWSRGPRWLHHRHCGKSIRIAAVGWRALEKARLRRRLRCLV